MSDCFDSYAVEGCFNNAGVLTPVVIHYVHDGVGAPAVRITDVAGAIVAGADATNTTAGSCPIASPDVEFEQLCDQQADGSIVQFIRRTITTFSSAGVPTVVATDWALDYVTAYTVTGTVVNCPACDQLDAAQRGLQTAW